MDWIGEYSSHSEPRTAAVKPQKGNVPRIPKNDEDEIK
jgi:hypothetical protein